MNNTTVAKKKRGDRLTQAERVVAIAKLAEALTESYYSTNELSKMTGLSRRTVDRYRPLVDREIAEKRIDRNVIRNLQVQRTYKMIEMLMKDLERIESLNYTKDGVLNERFAADVHNITKSKVSIYNQIAKFSQHLALITGLNVETHVNVDHQQLVIIRADNAKKPKVIDVGDYSPKN